MRKAKITVSLILTIAILLAGIMLWKSNYKVEVKSSELQISNLNAGEGIFGAHSTAEYPATGNQKSDGGYSTPTIPGMEIYCVSHDAKIKTGEEPLKEDVLKFQEEHLEYTKSHSGRKPVHAGDSVKSAPKGPESIAYYRCVGNHTLVEGALAYVIYNTGGDWSGELQQAIWHGATEIESNNTKPAKTAEEYERAGDYEKAEDVRNYEAQLAKAGSYGEFYNSVAKNENGEMDPSVEITYGGTTMVDYDNEKFVVGPFNVDYIGTGGHGRIVDMDVSLSSTSGNTVNADEYSYYEGDSKYNPGTGAGQSYPKGGSDFSITYDNPGVGYTTITVTVTYEWDEYYAQLCQMKGVSYGIKWTESECSHEDCVHKTCDEPARVPILPEHTSDEECEYLAEGKECRHKMDNPHEHDDECYDDSCVTSCRAVSSIKEIPQQPIVRVESKKITKSKTVSITITKEDPPPGDDEEEEEEEDERFDPDIDIGGIVWEDLRTGKEGSVDGIRSDDEPRVSGATVILHRENGRVEATTTTDANGRYIFRDLDPFKRYYVEIQYNGQRYENTIYTDDLSGGYSNATESKSDRATFNQNFAEINGDEGYTLENQDDYAPNASFGISAYTGPDGKNKHQVYPSKEKFTIAGSESNLTVGGSYYDKIYRSEGENLLNIDFGITKRPEFDMAVKKDLFMATVKINGKTEVYGYDKKNLGNNDATPGEDTWDIQVVDGYQRGLDNSDYNFAGENGSKELLEVYATYKIAVRNQSQSMLGHVTSLLDYYDETYEYMPELSWVSSTNYKANDETTLDKLQEQIHEGKITEGNTPKVKSKQNNALSIDVGKKQSAGETVYIYLTFKIKNGDDNKVSLSEKENHVEIGAFKTYYKEGTILPHYGVNNYKITTNNVIAGRIDRDSIPSNYDGKEVKEDDEDKAPGLDVHLTGEYRKIQGTVWEDERTQNVNGSIIGNGIKDGSETKISGITVQLLELTASGKVCKWAETVTGEDGTYSFDGVIPGDYFVRFIYGTNGSKYNGQDYKSTIYQAGVSQSGKTDLEGKYNAYVDTENQNQSNGIATQENKYGYDISKAQENNSDAKDIWENATVKEFKVGEIDDSGNPIESTYTYNGRQTVINYSKEYVTNHKAEILNSLEETPNVNTVMTAETGVIVMEVEKNLQTTTESAKPSYIAENVDFGLVERPKAQLEIDKSISNIKIVLANGSVLFDVNQGTKVNDMIWQPKGRGNGLIQITMDEEIMHGAAIQITYKVKVTNTGEIDFEGKEFYYLGTNPGEKVATRADQIVDYLPNNLQFYDRAENNGWTSISKNELIKGESSEDNLINYSLKGKLDKFNTIIQTTGLNKELIPGGSTEKTLVLSQLITAENEDNDLTYSNMVEIVKTSNTVGRRMANSIVGNQDPTAKTASEVDSSMAEKVIILPPFGELHLYIILAAVVAIILIGGIILITKKVLK